MKKLILLSLPLFSFLQGADFMETDFIPRVANFVIFACIIYYFVADHAKKFFKGHQDTIRNNLVASEEKIANSKKQKKIASDKILESEKMAKEIIKTSEDESRLIIKQYKEQTNNLIANMKKLHEERNVLEEKKALRSVTQEVLNNFIDTSISKLDKSDILDILNKTINKKAS